MSESTLVEEGDAGGGGRRREGQVVGKNRKGKKGCVKSEP